MSNSVIVIGAGASGMMAAIQAARSGARVTVLEGNDRPGHKLAATGNGRCNFTNLFQEPGCYRSSLPGFPAAALAAFTAQDTIAFFTDLGIYSVNRDGYMYPRSMQARSMIHALTMELERLRVKVKTREKVTQLIREESGFTVRTRSWHYQADRVILAAGSNASAIQGAGRDGYELALAMGHRVIEPLPALTGLKCRGASFSAWAGVRTQAVVTLLTDGRPSARECGEIQLTEYGISGIPVFCVSRFAAAALREGKKVRACLDFFPDMTLSELQDFLARRRKKWPERTAKDLLDGLFPDRLCQILAGESDPAKAIKYFTLQVTGTQDFAHAQVCAGGVDVSQIDPETMESRLCDGLYLCGEVMDVDGTCGGYNLQWAWSSGAAAGRHAAVAKQEDRAG